MLSSRPRGLLGVATLCCVLALCEPCLAGPRRPWRARWWASAGLLIASNILDVHSSRGLAEANPLLRDPSGAFSGGRAVAVKVSASGALLLLEAVLLRGGESRLEKPFAVTNTVCAGFVTGMAIRNYRLPRAGTAPIR